MHQSPASIEELPPAWCRKYVGKKFPPPYGCFYLAAEVLREEFGIERIPTVADFPQATEGTLRAHASAIAEGLRGHCIEINQENDLLLEGDLIAIGPKERMYHIGVLVAKNWMLHSHEGADSCLERINSLKWRGRIGGYFRPIR